MLERYREQAVAAVQRVVGDPAEAEDCVQEAMLRLVRRGDLDPGRVRSLLARAATHIAIDRRRSRHRQERAVARLRAAAATREAPSPEDIAGEHADVERAMAAIDSLPRRERQVMLMRLSGLSPSETAQRLGLSYKSVEGAYTRARARVKLFLGGALAWLVARLRRLAAPGGEAFASAVAVLVIAAPLWHDDGKAGAREAGGASPQLLAAAPGNRLVDGAGRHASPVSPDSSADHAAKNRSAGGGATDEHGRPDDHTISFNTGPVSVPNPTGGGDPNNTLIYVGGVGVSNLGPPPIERWAQCPVDGHLPEFRNGDCYSW